MALMIPLYYLSFLILVTLYDLFLNLIIRRLSHIIAKNKEDLFFMKSNYLLINQAEIFGIFMDCYLIIFQKYLSLIYHSLFLSQLDIDLKFL